MGMFDEVVCRYRLPHHQEARFQTKDLAAVALRERCLGGLLDEYLITEDGRLRRHVHEREWVEDAGAPFRGYLRSVRDWWEDVPGAHGDVLIYTSEPVIASPRGTSDETADAPAANGATAEGPVRFIEFLIRFTHGRVEHVVDLSEPRPPGAQAVDIAQGAPDDVKPAQRIPPRGAEERLLAGIKASCASLEALLERANDHWGREDVVYRYYHQSFKVYAIQSLTLAIVAALQQLLPDHSLCTPFRQIIDAGTGKRFRREHNEAWAETTRPMIEAFLHAHYFLEMVVKYGRSLESPPPVLPSGWAAVLTLYGLR